MKTREDAKKREFSRVAQGSASGAQWRKGATLTDRKLEQKCVVTHFKATGLKVRLGASRRAAGEEPGA